jgi:hypothetical protein
MAEAVQRLSSSALLLARCFEKLAPVLRKPLLLIVDQAEELFTLRVDAEAERRRALYFDFLAAHCERTSWIQILISMRTEFLGRFDDELRRRLGDSMPVAPYYLQPFTAELLKHVVTQPVGRTFESAAGVSYRLRFEPELPRLIAESVAARFPGPGALTCVQIVCRRLTEYALSRLGSPARPDGVEVLITHEMLQEFGEIGFAIEDVIDQAVAGFCDSHELLLIEGLLLWKACKRSLSHLVNQQTGGAPTTRFIERERFIEMLAKALNERPIAFRLVRSVVNSEFAQVVKGRLADRPIVTALVDHLLSTDVRVLRELVVVELGATAPTRYVALGHDILSVALAEWLAREEAIERLNQLQSRRERRLMLVWAIVLALASAGVAVILYRDAWTEWLDAGWSIGLAMGGGAGVGFYAASLQGLVGRLRYLRERRLVFERFAKDHPPADASMRESIVLMLLHSSSRHLFSRFASVGSLYRQLTAEMRRRAAPEGSAVFPGGARY